MNLPSWSLKTLLASVLLFAVSLIALMNPWEDIAFTVGVSLAATMVVAAAVAAGTRGRWRTTSVAFLVGSLLTLYVNDANRKSLSALPSDFDNIAADWLNDRFGWAELTGPPNTWVYWSLGNRIHYVSFDDRGNVRSQGALNLSSAERELGEKIDLNNLPSEIPRPGVGHLRRIVSVLVAAWMGLLMVQLVHLAGPKTRSA